MFFGLCSRLAFLGSWLTILGFFNSSSFIFIVSAALGREFMASGIYIHLYIGIYMFRVGSVVRQFYSILFYFEWKVHKKRSKKKYRALSCSHSANENVEEIIYFFAQENEEGAGAGEGKRQRTRGNILSYFALNFNRI